LAAVSTFALSGLVTSRLGAAAMLALSLVLAGATTAAAQSSSSAGSSAPVPDASYARLLSRVDVSFSWANLLTTDRRFDWQGQLLFDADLFDYGSGRATFVSRYEGTLGRERRRYDLNQGSYFFEFAGSQRIKSVELMVLGQHVSRHEVDRENQPAVSWNTVGVRLEKAWRGRGTRGWQGSRVKTQIEISRPMQQAFVDYRWLSRARATVTRPLSDRTAIVIDATGDVIGVDTATRGRSRVCGGRIEGALRIRGGAGAVELFAGYERRIDAYPTDRFRVRWFMAGFRLTNF
jgi:hypothetical protein